MAIPIEALNISKQYSEIYNTSNERYVLGKDFENVLATTEYSILGFLNNHIYCSGGHYLAKNNLNGIEISRMYIECDHASFFEGKEFFYAWKENVVYKITEQLSIEWSITFESDIQNIVMDTYGCFYVVYEGHRIIRKFGPNKEDIMFITESDDVTKKCEIYRLFVTPGGRFLYAIGSQFYNYNSAVDSFIDKYDIQKGEKVDRLIFAHDTYVNAYDELYQYDNIVLKGDYFYIYAKQYIMKMNIRGVELWRYTVAYNSITGKYDQIGHIEFDDNSFEEYLYFCEDLYSSNGHTFGKLYPNGKLVWKLSLEESVQSAKFKMAIYQNKIYTANRSNVEQFKSYNLALNGGDILFKTRNGKLLKIIEYNKELYSADNYEGFRFLGRQIKNGVEPNVLIQLKHDIGNIVTEDGKALFITTPNPNYTSEDNYEYFGLLCSEYSDEPNQLSILSDANHHPLVTLLGSLLKTSSPYNGDTMNQHINTEEGERLNTVTGEHIVRARNGYVQYNRLLADRNIFKEYIISKYKGYRLTTKDKGYEIIRRVRTVYRYILSKYNDIDIVVEWLLQNDITNTVLPEYVDKLRHHTVSAIERVQMAGVPTLYDIQATKKFEYTFNNYTYTNQVYGSQIFVCNNLPFTKRNAEPDRIYMDSIANLVEERKMRPFLLFLNGRAIKWSDCVIVKDWSYTFVIIRGTDVNDSDLKCVIFPCNIRYGEDNNILDSRLGIEHLYFDNSGLLTETRDDIVFRIETIDSNINGNTQYDHNKIEVPAEYNQISSAQNILVFEDGKLVADSRFYLTYYGKNLFKYNLLDRTPTDISFKVFYYMKTNEYLGNIVKVPNQKDIKDGIEDRVVNGTNTEISADNFNVPFEFKLYRTKPYDQNIAEAVAYIMSYDMNLLIQYYKQQSNLKPYIYTGEDIIKRAANTREPGFLFLPRSKRNGLDDYVIMFVNDELYEYNHQIEYIGREFKIPVFDHVKRDDIVEILHFRNVNNESHTLTVDNKVDDYIDEKLRYGNFLLFGHSAEADEIMHLPSYVHNPNLEYGAIMYDLEFDYKNNFDSNGKYLSTSIKLDDSNYYGKTISIASRRQFHYMYYNVFENRTRFNLTPVFRYCHFKNQYMVFVNKKRLSFNDFDLHIHMSETTEKWNYITTSKVLHKGDIVEIYYIPDAYEEVESLGDKSKGYGDIVVDLNDLGYQFDKDLFMIFVNGNKINNNSLINISANRVRIKNKSGVIDAITVIKMLQPDKILSEIVSYSDTWSKSIDSLKPKDFEKLFLKAIKK